MIKTVNLGELKSLLVNDQVVVQRKNEICTINLGNFLSSMLEFNPLVVNSQSKYVTLTCDKNVFTLDDESLQEKISSIDGVIDHLKQNIERLDADLNAKTKEFNERIDKNRIALNVFKNDAHVSLSNLRDEVSGLNGNLNTVRIDFNALEKRVSALERDIKSFLNTFKSGRAK